MVVGAEAQQQGAQQRARREIERARRPRPRRQPARPRPVRQTPARSTSGSGTVRPGAIDLDAARRRSPGEGGAQDLVAAHDLAERRAPGPGPQRPGEARRGRDVVGGRARDRAGRGTRAAAGRRRGAARRPPARGTRTMRRSLRGPPAPSAASTIAAQIGERRRLEERAQRQLDAAARRAAARRIWVARSECPPRSKKSSWVPTASTPSTSAQIRGQHLLDRRARRDEPGRGLGRPPADAGRARRSTLPLGGERQARRARRRPAGSCSAGRLSAQEARAARPESARRTAGAPRPGDEPQSPPAPGRGAATTASRTAGLRAASAASISPSSMRIAADLHLVVEPAQELDRAVRPPAREVAGAVEAAARRAANGIGDEALGGQLGPPEVAAGQPDRRRWQISPATPSGTGRWRAVEHVEARCRRSAGRSGARRSRCDGAPGRRWTRRASRSGRRWLNRAKGSRGSHGRPRRAARRR